MPSLHGFFRRNWSAAHPRNKRYLAWSIATLLGVLPNAACTTVSVMRGVAGVQPYEIAWTVTHGGADSLSADGVAVSSSGDIFVSGVIKGLLDGQDTGGSYDAYLMKFDQDGVRLWTRLLATEEYEHAEAVQVDAGGQVYVAGMTAGSLDGNANRGPSDAFLAKFDSDGTRLWVRQLGSEEDDRALGLTIDAAGDIYMVGFTKGSLDGHAKTGTRDAFLMKFDPGGGLLWTVQLATAVGRCVASDAAGNVYVAGSTNGALDRKANPGGRDSDAFLSKFDANGTRLWTRQPGTTADDQGLAVAVDASGNAFLSVMTRGSLARQRTYADYDIALLKYDATGRQLWARQEGTIGSDKCPGVAIDGTGNALLACSLDDLDLATHDIHMLRSSRDPCLMKFDTQGTRQWTIRIDSRLKYDDARSIAIDSSGKVYVAGQVNSDRVLLMKFADPAKSVSPRRR